LTAFGVALLEYDVFTLLQEIDVRGRLPWSEGGYWPELYFIPLPLGNYAVASFDNSLQILEGSEHAPSRRACSGS
jgi:hypothetical protein